MKGLLLAKLPGLGYRSAERIALHLLVEKPEQMSELVSALESASTQIQNCSICGNLSEDTLCSICADPSRDTSIVCVVERIPDLVSMERSGAYRGVYHVLHGKLSPIHGIGPEMLNMDSLNQRLRAQDSQIGEVILALTNDIEGEATCHYIGETYIGQAPVKVTRIGFGLPSGGGVVFADPVTLKSALDARRHYS